MAVCAKEGRFVYQRPQVGSVGHHEMICQRCYMVAELGRCPFCRRQLCVTCYDADQDYPCRKAPLGQRDEAIRALHGSMTAGEIAKSFGLTKRSVRRVMSG